MDFCVQLEKKTICFRVLNGILHRNRLGLSATILQRQFQSYICRPAYDVLVCSGICAREKNDVVIQKIRNFFTVTVIERTLKFKNILRSGEHIFKYLNLKFSFNW